MLNVKNDRSGKCENILNANVKSGRSGKCEKKLYAKCEKSLVSCMTGQFGQFGRPGQFCRHFRVSGCQHSKS